MADDGEGEYPAPAISWGRTELLVLAALVVAGVLALGGLAAGVAAASISVAGTGEQYLNGQAIRLGAGWAEPLLALFLLGALVLSLGSDEKWGRAAADRDDVARAHYWRARRTALLANVLLGTTVLGAASGVAGVALAQASLPPAAVTGTMWSQEFLAIAGLVGTVIVMMIALVMTFRRIGAA